MTADVKTIWDEWKRITRFLKSSRIAFNREQLFLSNLGLEANAKINLSSKTGQGAYSISVAEHLECINTDEVLHSTVLVSTYALAESFARWKLGLSDDDDLSGGIESWGKNVLQQYGRNWSHVLGGAQGMIEISAIRNALAHGIRNVNQTMINRFQSHSKAAPWAIGDKIDLSYDRLEVYRARIKSFMRFGMTASRVGPSKSKIRQRTRAAAKGKVRKAKKAEQKRYRKSLRYQVPKPLS